MKLAILGMGTVGCGVVDVLYMNERKITQLIGEEVTISHAFVNNIGKGRPVDLEDVVVTDNIEDVYEANVDAVIEVMGGMEDTRDILKNFLGRGIDVISANKDMLAKYIDELTEVADQNGAKLLYEASVAGGIPILHAIEHGLNANEITKVMGILNGTTNYILSKMTNDGWDYDTALAAAKEEGYAEADPTNDVGGFDAQRKIVLLSRLAYNRKVDIDEVPVRGIDEVALKDIEIAGSQNLVLKLVGKSGFSSDGLSIEVAPVLFPSSHQLASVDYEKNAVYVIGNAVGETMFYGPGAGGPETASAVVSDLINSRRNRRSNFNLAPEETTSVKTKAAPSSWYIRAEGGAQTLRQHLSENHVEFETVEHEGGTAFITAPISAETLESIENSRDFEITALYLVEGVESNE